MGMAALDNFTPEVVDAIAPVVRVLKGQSQARRIVLVGHSGGATSAANILGRNPGLGRWRYSSRASAADTKPSAFRVGEPGTSRNQSRDGRG